MAREALLARTLVELSNYLDDDFNLVDLLTLLSDRCADALDVAAAGVMIAAPGGQLEVMASDQYQAIKTASERRAANDTWRGPIWFARISSLCRLATT